MNKTKVHPLEDLDELEFQKFIEDGLQSAHNHKRLDFDKTFDELEERYKKANV